MVIFSIVYELLEQRWRLRPDAGILFLLIMVGLWTCVRIWWPREGDEAMPGWAQREREDGWVTFQTDKLPRRKPKILQDEGLQALIDSDVEPEPRRWNEVE